MKTALSRVVEVGGRPGGDDLLPHFAPHGHFGQKSPRSHIYL